MELNSLLKDMGLVDAFSTTLSQDIEPIDQGPCESSCTPGCSSSCDPGCSGGCSATKKS
jgi:hypothetical protein